MVKAIGTQLRGRREKREEGKDPVSKHYTQPGWKMSRLTRDGTTEPVSRDQILRLERGNQVPRSADHERD